MIGKPGTGKYEQLLERCKRLEPVVTAVAHPCEESALTGAVEAGANGYADAVDLRMEVATASRTGTLEQALADGEARLDGRATAGAGAAPR